MQHLKLRPIIACSNDDLKLTLSYFTARSSLVSYAFIMGKTGRTHLIEKSYRVTKDVYLNTKCCPRAIYMYTEGL